MRTTYTALTIGPIFDTISRAKRTRSIWAASYFFSMVIKEILRSMINSGKKDKIILPFREDIYDSNYGSGLYADRLYFKGITKDELQNAVNTQIKFFADDLNNQKICTENEALSFLNKYLNLHIVEFTLTNDELETIKASIDTNGLSNNSVLKILNQLLDNKELNKRYVFDFDNDYIIDYLSLKWSANTALKINAFSQNSGRYFTSIGEIATVDLKEKYKNKYSAALQKDFKNDDLEFIDELSKAKKKDADGNYVSIIEDYHKYYAVLYADGDNIGDLLRSVANDDAALQTFSKLLLDFGLKAEETIANFGGSGIYLGGEDILAFLPVANKAEDQIKTLAELIKNLDKDFNDTLVQYAKKIGNIKTPTLSYGIMLSYYKFPIQEAMSQAYEQLEICKKNRNLFPDKNGIAIRFQKHSGSFMECYIDKNKWKSSILVYRLLTRHLNAPDKKDILNGLIQRLRDGVFFSTFMEAVRNNQIDAFFENFFNEAIHQKKQSFTDFFKELVKVQKDDYLTQNPTDKEEENIRLRDILFTVLRYYKFVK